MATLGFTLMFFSYFVLWLATPVWIVKLIYDLVKTDDSFWFVLLSNTGCWVLTLVVGFILMWVGYLTVENSK